jgi:hypothetical protein
MYLKVTFLLVQSIYLLYLRQSYYIAFLTVLTTKQLNSRKLNDVKIGTQELNDLFRDICLSKRLAFTLLIAMTN